MPVVRTDDLAESLVQLVVFDDVRILLVDDSAVLRRMAAATLRNVGSYVVDEAVDASEALAMMARERYDIVVTDLYMPGMDGLEFVRLLRTRPEYSDLPIVMITSEQDPFAQKEATDAGVDDFLVKPLDPVGLRNSLRRLLADGHRVPEHDPLVMCSSQVVLDAVPYPAMILDENHNVLLGNEAFWSSTGAGINDTGLRCMSVMHADGVYPEDCPLLDAARGNVAIERIVEERDQKLLVSVYPMHTSEAGGERLFLHLSRPFEAAK